MSIIRFRGGQPASILYGLHTHTPHINYALIKDRRTAFFCVVPYSRLLCPHALVKLAVLSSGVVAFPFNSTTIDSLV
jgi:hypothetical protein